MKILPIVALAAFLISLEAGILHWRSSAPVSSAPVFALPMMAEAIRNPGGFHDIVIGYRADRGGEMRLLGPAGTSLTLFYFEWDQIEAGPMMSVVGHVPEQCNVAAGFTLQSLNPDRIFESPGQAPLKFDSTTFTDPAGRTTFVYKGAWMQGYGSRDIREGLSRKSRFNNSFERGRGAARVVECGVVGAKDEGQAWQIFQSEVIEKLKWSL